MYQSNTKFPVLGLSPLVLDYQNFQIIRQQIKGILLYLGEKFLFNSAGPYGIGRMWVHLQLTALCNPENLLLKAMDDTHPFTARQKYLPFQFLNLTDNIWQIQSADSLKLTFQSSHSQQIPIIFNFRAYHPRCVCITREESNQSITQLFWYTYCCRSSLSLRLTSYSGSHGLSHGNIFRVGFSDRL